MSPVLYLRAVGQSLRDASRCHACVGHVVHHDRASSGRCASGAPDLDCAAAEDTSWTVESRG